MTSPNRFKDSKSRNLMLTTLVLDPSVRDCLRQLLRMGATNIRPDYMLVKAKEGESGNFSRNPPYNQVDDPGAWYGYINNHLSVMMLKGTDGVWFLNGS